MYFGKEINNGDRLHIDRIEKYLSTGNANMLLIGSAGSGKTQMCFREITELQGITVGSGPVKVYYFTPDKDSTIYEEAILFARKVQSDNVRIQVHTFCELTNTFLSEEGLYPKHDYKGYCPNFIYIDGIDEMTLEQLTFLEEIMKGINGYRNIFTLCMKEIWPAPKYRSLHTNITDICILGYIPYHWKGIYPLNKLTPEEFYTLNTTEWGKTSWDYGCVFSHNKPEQKSIFYKDKSGIPLEKCTAEELSFVV